MPVERARGGFVKPVQLSLFIRDQLAGGAEWWGHDLYQSYKEEIQKAYDEIDARRSPKRRKGKRKVISWEGFRHYLYVLRRLGLIEYVLDASGEVVGDVAMNKGGQEAPYLSKTRLFRANLSRIGDPAWSNIWKAYLG